TGQSLLPFKDDYFVQFIHIILIISGSIGFPVLVEVKDYLQRRREKRQYLHFSLFTKLTSLTYVGLILFGFIIIMFLEWGNFLLIIIIYVSISFPVIVEVKDYLQRRREKRQYLHFSLFTKLTSLTYVGLLLFGFIIFMILEWGNFLLDKQWHEVLFYSLFQST